MPRFSSYAQAPDWQTALVAGQPAGGSSRGQSTTTAAAGNVYIAGNFIGTITLGTFSLTSATANSDDIFVAKWSPVSRSFVWAQQAGSASADVAYAVAVSGSNVYLTGSFRGTTASFGNSTLTNDNIGVNDMFVAKITDAGTTANFTWAVQPKGASSTSEGRALAVSGASIYVTSVYFVTGASDLDAVAERARVQREHIEFLKVRASAQAQATRIAALRAARQAPASEPPA